MPVEIEERSYGPESTTEEIEALRDRVWIYSEADGIVMYEAVPVQSPFQIQIFENRLAELTETMDSFNLLIDLTETKPPDAETRACLKQAFSAQTKLKRVAVFTGRNFMLSVAAKFVLGSVTATGATFQFSIHKTFEEALEALLNVL